VPARPCPRSGVPVAYGCLCSHTDRMHRSRSLPAPSQDPEASTLASARESAGACETQPGPPQECTAREATEAAARSPSNPGPGDRRSRGRSAHTRRCSRPRHGRPRCGPAGGADGPSRCRGRADRQAGCHSLLRHDAQPPVTAITGTRYRGSGRAGNGSGIGHGVRIARTAHSYSPPGNNSCAAGVWSSMLVCSYQRYTRALRGEMSGRAGWCLVSMCFPAIYLSVEWCFRQPVFGGKWVSSPEPAVGVSTPAGTCPGRLRRHRVIGYADPGQNPPCSAA
jgi:hypothetical protein